MNNDDLFPTPLLFKPVEGLKVLYDSMVESRLASEALQYTEAESDTQIAKLLPPTSLILSYKHLGYPKNPGASNERR